MQDRNVFDDIMDINKDYTLIVDYLKDDFVGLNEYLQNNTPFRYEIILCIFFHGKFIMTVNYADIIWYEENTSPKPSEEEIIVKRDLLISNLNMIFLRYEWDKLLLKTDKYSIPDWPHSSDTKKQEWLAYRQALRDLPSNQTPQLDSDGMLTNVTWPSEPTGS